MVLLITMITVIIAGGSGTRLWPLSTPDFPKHLLKIGDSKKSLLQHTYDRAAAISSHVYVVTDSSHAHVVKDQLSELPDEAFVVEPARRGTASCVIAGLGIVAQKHGSEEPIAFVAADQYVRDGRGFRHTFAVAAKASEEHDQIVLVGVEPDYPATGFGYIEKGQVVDERQNIFSVESFKEKPDYLIAQKYLKSGNYLWNCSFFVGSVNTFLSAMEKYAPELLTAYKDLSMSSSTQHFKKTYLDFKNEAIDYALIEKVRDLLVVPASFDWMDLGSYTDLHKAVDSDEDGNHVRGANIEIEDVHSSFIQNYEDKPVAVIGLDNVIVVNTPNGIVVSRKDLSQKVGDISKRFNRKP